MKKAIIITACQFNDLELATIHGIKRTERLLRSVLGDSNFGNFDEVACLSDMTFGDLQTQLEAEVESTDPKALLYIHIVTHGIQTSGSDIVLALKDSFWVSKDSSKIGNALTPEILAKIILSQRARDIGITLDCCLSDMFRQQLIERIDQFEEPNSIQQGRRKKLHFISQVTDRTEFAFSDQSGSRFSNKLCEWLVTGETSSSSPLIEYAGFEQHSTHDRVEPKIEYCTHNAKFSFVIGNNPNRGLLIDPHEIRKLLSEDNQVLVEGLTFLREQAGFATASRLTTIKKYLPLFEKILPDTASTDSMQAFLELTRTINGQRHSSEEKEHCLLVYFTRNWRSALMCDRKLSEEGNDTLLFDLNFASGYNYRGDNLFEQMEYARKVYIIIDQEWSGQISAEYYELSTFLIEGEISDKFVAILDESNGPIQENIRAIRDLKRIELDSFCGEVSFTSDDEAIGRSIFLDCLLVNQKKLESQGGDGARTSDTELFFDDAIKVRNAPMRIPNFLVYSIPTDHEKGHILAIVDGESKINPNQLTPSHLPQIDAELTPIEELGEMGLEPGKIGPVFPNAHKELARIVVDGSIFFQFLLFPLTPVRVPNVHDGVDHPIELPISSFIRSLQQFYGEKNLLYSNIVRRRKFHDPILLKLLENHPVFTRFAPTPSSSLHLGNIRTALVSYLFVLSTRSRSQFHIRFDDTNPKHKFNDVERGDILRDLDWIGIPTEATYRQTSQDAHRVYDLAADILCSAGLLRESDESTGGREFNPTEIDQGFAYWLDLQKGPQFIHRAPREFEHRNPKKSEYSNRLDYTIDWPDRSYKYKFAGVLDDVCLNTVVIRDGRQENSLFTARQSIILGALRNLIAKPTNDEIRSKSGALKNLAKERVQLSRLPHSKKNIRPFPFGAPPIYLHVPRVCDEDGKVLSKRSNVAQHSIKDIRSNGRLLPETILSWALSTMGNRVLRGIGATGTRHLEEIVANFGVKGTYDLISNRVSFLDVLAGQTSGDIRIGNLQKSDARILSKLGPIRFGELCQRLWQQAGGRRTVLLHEISIEEIFFNRSYFCGCNELFEFLRRLKLSCSSSNLDKLLLDVEEYLSTTNPSTALHQSMRLTLFGKPSGPPARVLAELALPSIVFNRKEAP